MIDELDRELRAVGVPARRRRRIRLEIEDHLACDPSADLGDPRALARQFADELGTLYARRAGFAVFLVLVPFGLLFGAVFAFAAVYTTSAPPLLTAALVGGVQFAFVGGTLSLLRAWRLRRLAVIPAVEAHILIRRACLAIAGAALTVIPLGLLTSGYYQVAQWSSRPLGWATVGVGAAAVLLGATAVVRSLRLLPAADGKPADLSFDLGVRADPWLLAVAIAGAVALCIAVAGGVQSDPLDGLARALVDGSLCLAGFAVLGRPLGLRA
ncbi:MAG TPA: hypothetical protein VMU72_04715 [Gaiellaceae bacterium]|nr:hypothetical protein [Gaiellaceae bacterium]